MKYIKEKIQNSFVELMASKNLYGFLKEQFTEAEIQAEYKKWNPTSAQIQKAQEIATNNLRPKLKPDMYDNADKATFKRAVDGMIHRLEQSATRMMNLDMAMINLEAAKMLKLALDRRK